MTPISATFFQRFSHRCAGVNLQYGLLEGVSCDSRSSTLAASNVGEEILLHNGPDGSDRPPESSLGLFIYFKNDMVEEPRDQ